MILRMVLIQSLTMHLRLSQVGFPRHITSVRLSAFAVASCQGLLFWVDITVRVTQPVGTRFLAPYVESLSSWLARKCAP